MKNKCIVFTGGGTGGHIYPGLAVADELKSLDPLLSIVWIGSNKGMDKTLVEKSESADVFKGIPSGKLRRYFSFRNFIDLFRITGGFFSSLFILKKYKPEAVFSKGGFVSVPPCIAAKFLGIPVYTHECDYSPGLATKLNARFAKRILVSFEKTKSFFDEKKQAMISVTGNPVRPVFYSASEKRGEEFLGIKKNESLSRPVLLVLGGSLGARQLNTLVFKNIEWLSQRFTVVHQTGKDAFLQAEELSRGLEKKGNTFYKPYAFFYSEMSDVIACADVVLSRAGSNFLWECAVCAKPLVLIPLCGSGTRGDQVENAHFFEENNAAIVLLGDDADEKNIKSALERMLLEENRQNFSKAAKNLVGSRKSALEIATILKTEVLDV